MDNVGDASWLPGGEETDLNGSAYYGGQCAPSIILGGMRGTEKESVEGNAQDFSYHVFAADADLIDTTQAAITTALYNHAARSRDANFALTSSSLLYGQAAPSLSSTAEGYHISPISMGSIAELGWWDCNYAGRGRGAGSGAITHLHEPWSPSPSSSSVRYGEGGMLHPSSSSAAVTEASQQASSGCNALQQSFGSGSNGWTEPQYSSPSVGGPSPMSSFSSQELSQLPGSHSPAALKTAAPFSTNTPFRFDSLHPYHVPLWGHSLENQPYGQRPSVAPVSTGPFLSETEHSGSSPTAPFLGVLGSPLHQFPRRAKYRIPASWNADLIPSDLAPSPSPSVSKTYSDCALWETESNFSNNTSQTGYYFQPPQSEASSAYDASSSSSQRLHRSLSSQSSRRHAGSQSLGRSFSPNPIGGRKSSGRRVMPLTLLHPGPLPEKEEEVGGSFQSVPKKRRGVRKRPLSHDKRMAANKTKNDKSVCIGCKRSKVGCEPGSNGRCLRCENSPHKETRPFECVRAYFDQFVHEASTNLSTTQYVLNHSGARRVVDLPPSIDMGHLLNRIDTWRAQHIRSIGVYLQDNDRHSQYQLDLAACYTYLKYRFPPSRTPFQSFLNDMRLHKDDDWKTRIHHHHHRGGGLLPDDDDDDIYERHLVWNEPSSPAAFSLITSDFLIHSGGGGGGGERVLDPDSGSPDELEDLLAAVQLSRIIGRKLELAAYERLQKELLLNGPVTESLLWDLGRIVMSLRRRVSRWRCLGRVAEHVTLPFGGGGDLVDDYMRMGLGREDHEQEEEEEEEEEGHSANHPHDTSTQTDQADGDPIGRVTSLCFVLYTYWLFLQRQATPRLTATSRLKPLRVHYPDGVQPVLEEFPRIESRAGFRRWMDEGVQKLREAGVVVI